MTIGFAAASLLFFFTGFAAQDWDAPAGDPTGGQHDATWGTWLTDYALAVEGFVMASLAPGAGMVRKTLITAFTLDACGWALGGLLHQAFPEDGHIHGLLWVVALATQVLGAVVRPCAAHMMITDIGKCPRCSSWLVQTIYGGIALLSVLLVVATNVAQAGQWLVVGAINILSALTAVVYGCVGEAPKWAGAVFASFALATALNLVKFEPFKSSKGFNDNALFHSAMMLYGLALYGLFLDIAAKSVPLRKMPGDFMAHSGPSTAVGAAVCLLSQR